MSFVHLQTHSEFSLLRSTCRVKELLHEAIQNNQPAIALTDHGNMFGILEFYMEAQKLNKERQNQGLSPINAILGSHIYVEASTANTKEEQSYHRLTLLVKSNEGYQNLLKIVSYCYEDDELYKEIPAVPLEFIQKHSEGLFALAGDYFSRFGTDVLSGKKELAKEYFVSLTQIFDRDHLYFTIQNQNLENQSLLNAAVIEFSKELDRALVAVNNVHYIKEDDAQLHKILRCIQAAEKIQDFEDFLYPGNQYYFKSTEKMIEDFKEYPEAISNTVKIAEQCSVVIKTNCGDEFWPQYKFPSEFSDADAFLAHLCNEKVKERYDELSPAVIDRMEEELSCIKEMKVAGYLLIVWDFINWAKENGIPVGPGRGSAAGSIVTYIIGITNIEPLRFDLLFERFLNPERVSMPDIDTDFADKDRGRVFQYVIEQYGKDCVTQIVTYGTLKAKAVINDVARVLGIAIQDVRQITRLLPTIPNDASLEMAKTGKKKGVPLDGYSPEPLNELIESKQIYKDLWSYCERLENIARQIGVHAAAVIIAPVPMSYLAPLYRAKKGDPTAIMYDKHYVEDIGLLKMDFLGLKNLSIIQDTVNLIKKTQGIEIDIDNISLEDSKTFDLVAKGLTTGVFQFESPGMRDYLRKLAPERLEDLIAMNALYRPGPMDQIPHFIARKRGDEEIDYYHPDLEPILKETYGVIVYQEQVMRIAQKMGGYSLGGADVLRRIMGKKRPEEMAKLEPEFIQKCKERGYELSLIKTIWAVLLPFCGYAFNKSHAAAYAYVAYQTAYLKANYGAEFMAASMTNTQEVEKRVALLQECDKIGVRYLSPNVNSSYPVFTVKNGEVLYGLAGIKNVGKDIVEDIVQERELNGKYESLFDLCKRVLDYQSNQVEKRPPLNKKTLESLIMAGALDELEGSRSAQLASIDKAFEVANRHRQNMDSGQTSFFDIASEESHFNANVEVLEDADEWTYIELLNKEKEVLGIYLSGHPLEEYRPELQGFTTCSLAESEVNNSGLLKKMISVGGVITRMRSFQTKRGDTIGSGELQDFHGEISLFIKSEKWEAYRDRISTDDRVLVQGVLEQQKDDKGPQIIVDKFISLEKIRQEWVRFLHVSLHAFSLNTQKLEALEETLKSSAPFPGEQACQIVFHIETDAGYKHVLLSKNSRFKYEVSLLDWLQKNLPVTSIWVSNKVKA